MEHELTEEVFETFRAVASEAAVEAYEARDWLRFPEELLGTP